MACCPKAIHKKNSNKPHCWRLKRQEKYLNLTKMKTNKDFDAVKMMHEIRQKRHEEYKKNPQLREQRLTAIHKKYADKIKSQQTASHMLKGGESPQQLP